MPTVSFRGTEIECESGAVLRDALLDAGLSPHNGRANALNCRGHATCGTCAVTIETPDGRDPVAADAANEVGSRERARLSMPPHSRDSKLRLSCQTRVYDDLVVRKYDGFWGQHVPAGADGTGADKTDGAERE